MRCTACIPVITYMNDVATFPPEKKSPSSTMSPQAIHWPAKKAKPKPVAMITMGLSSLVLSRLAAAKAICKNTLLKTMITVLVTKRAGRSGV